LMLVSGLYMFALPYLGTRGNVSAMTEKQWR
jgi:hypothetical protein